MRHAPLPDPTGSAPPLLLEAARLNGGQLCVHTELVTRSQLRRFDAAARRSHFAVLLARSPASVGGALPWLVWLALLQMARVRTVTPAQWEAFEVHGASASLRPPSRPAPTLLTPRELVTASEVEATPAPMPDWAAVAASLDRPEHPEDAITCLVYWPQLRQAVAQHTAAELDRVEAQIVSGLGGSAVGHVGHPAVGPAAQVLRGPEPAALRSAEVAIADAARRLDGWGLRSDTIGHDPPPAPADATLARRDELLASGELLTAREVATQARGGVVESNPNQYASRLRREHRLIGARFRNGYRHPRFQFDTPNGELNPRVADLLAVLPQDDDTGWSAVFWCYHPSRALDGRTPAEVFPSDPVRVIAAASQEFRRSDDEW